MGRMKIKKRDTVIPLRETLAYRMMLLAASIVAFGFAGYQLITSFRSESGTVGLVIAGVVGACAMYGIVFNADRLKTARIPARAAKRMARR